MIAIAVLALMLLFVLPRFMGLFEQLDAELPPTTKILVALSNGLRAYWWALPVVGCGVLRARAGYARPRAGRQPTAWC